LVDSGGLWRSHLPKRRLSRRSVVVVRTDQGWRITAIHTGRVRPITVPDPDALPSRMSRLMTHTAHRLDIGHHRATAHPDAHTSAPPRQRARSDGH
jgi:hypothetical protein